MSAIVSPVREPLITGSKTYHQITEDICAPTEKTPNLTWVIAFCNFRDLSVIWFVLHRLDYLVWNWFVESQPDNRLGMGYHQLCLVDWYRSCRNPYFRHSLDISSKMAYRGKPGCGGDDHLCCDMCRAIPGDSRR